MFITVKFCSPPALYQCTCQWWKVLIVNFNSQLVQSSAVYNNKRFINSIYFLFLMITTLKWLNQYTSHTGLRLMVTIELSISISKTYPLLEPGMIKFFLCRLAKKNQHGFWLVHNTAEYQSMKQLFYLFIYLFIYLFVYNMNLFWEVSRFQNWAKIYLLRPCIIQTSSPYRGRICLHVQRELENSTD